MLGRDKDAAAVRFPPPLIYLVAIAIGWCLHEYVVPFGAAANGIWLDAMAWLYAIVGTIMALYAAGLFFRTGQNPEPWKTTPSIVTHGIYRWTRNPMYVGMALWQAAIALWLANAWIAVMILPALVAVYHIAIKPEEQYLEEKFGDAYLEYKERVRRWL